MKDVPWLSLTPAAPDDAPPLEKEGVWPSEEEVLLVAGYSKSSVEKATLRARMRKHGIKRQKKRS